MVVSSGQRNINNTFTVPWNITSEETRSTLEIYSAVGGIVTIFLISLVGNLIICLLTITKRCLKKPSNILVFHLAVSDIGLVCSNAPFSVLVLLNGGSWVYSDVFCQLNGAFKTVFIFTSLGTMASIAMQRYLQICRYEFYSRHISMNKIIGEYCTANTNIVIFSQLDIYLF